MMFSNKTKNTDSVESDGSYEVEVSETAANAELTAQDRCDSCGAQAYVKVDLDSNKTLSLMFCNHHYMRHEAALSRKNYLIHDESHKLYA